VLLGNNYKLQIITNKFIYLDDCDSEKKTNIIDTIIYNYFGNSASITVKRKLNNYL